MVLDCVVSSTYTIERELGEYVHARGCESVADLFVDLLCDMRSGRGDVADLYAALFRSPDLLAKAGYFCEVARTSAFINDRSYTDEIYADPMTDEMREYWHAPGATDGLLL